MIDLFSLITREQKHGLKCHKHQKIEQGKGYNMVEITHFCVFVREGRFSPAMPHFYDVEMLLQRFPHLISILLRSGKEETGS